MAAERVQGNSLLCPRSTWLLPLILCSFARAATAGDNFCSPPNVEPLRHTHRAVRSPAFRAFGGARWPNTHDLVVVIENVGMRQTIIHLERRLDTVILERQK